MSLDINALKKIAKSSSRYERRIQSLKDSGKYTLSIEHAVNDAIASLSMTPSGAFVIYGEPQSGKTEMMIALTARLLDKGHRMIVLLLNDSVQLLNQNLSRFRSAGLDPTPRTFSEILDPSVEVTDGEWVVFCKKNSKDLTKLIDKVNRIPAIVVIDDEADYATPNSKVNAGQVTKINSLIGKLLKKDGVYIGVTATPARLDLNRTFENDQEMWVDFPTHPHYKGQNFFFPANLSDLRTPKYRLNLMPDNYDLAEHLRKALFAFLVNVAHLNIRVNTKECCYSMLIHTSGAKIAHSDDYKQVVEVFNVLRNSTHRKFERFAKELWEIASSRFPNDTFSTVAYVLENVNRNVVIVMNSDFDKRNQDYETATSPSTLFTIAIGGNIVSRGVTFNSLLSMFFTRDARHKIQQDTYIQRARMFGVRDYDLAYFDLHIPESLYQDWHRCFVFHRLALESIRAKNGAPVWLGDSRISTVAPASINRARLDMNSGEMSFAIFDWNDSIEEQLQQKGSPIERLQACQIQLGEASIPKHLIDFIAAFSPHGGDSVAIHSYGNISNYKDANHEDISRGKGLIGKSDREEARFPRAIHHIKPYVNTEGKARIIYKYSGSISFSRMIKSK